MEPTRGKCEDIPDLDRVLINVDVRARRGAETLGERRAAGRGRRDAGETLVVENVHLPGRDLTEVNSFALDDHDAHADGDVAVKFLADRVVCGTQCGA